jgi:hypothetical protein
MDDLVKYRALGHLSYSAAVLDRLTGYRCLAALHSMRFVTPSLVGLAARKIYPHRISICSAENDRSMQWGSDANVVTAMLAEITPDDIIQEVLGSVEVPL